MKSIDSEQFFRLVSVNSGIDLDSVRAVFYGMIKTISRELREKHIIKLPDWGEFRIKIHKSRNSINVNTGLPCVIPPKPTVKFVPDHNVKKYFYSFFE